MIPAGQLNAETAPDAFGFGPASNAAVEISSVSDCPTDLSIRIANDPNFSSLNELFSQVLNMPNSDDFIQNFDSTQLKNEGNPYLVNLTGLSISDITTIK